MASQAQPSPHPYTNKYVSVSAYRLLVKFHQQQSRVFKIEMESTTNIPTTLTQRATSHRNGISSTAIPLTPTLISK